MILLPIQTITHRGVETTYFVDADGKRWTVEELLYEIRYDELRIIVDFASAKYSIIEWILQDGTYKQNDEKFGSVDIKKDYIKFYINKKMVITFCSFENKFLQDFVDWKTARELERADEQRQATCAQDAKEALLKSISGHKNIFIAQNVFAKIFPQPTDEEFSIWEKSKDLVTSFYYLKQPDEYKHLHSYDIKSSFPSRVYGGVFPQGNGIKTDNLKTIPEKKWRICKIRVYQAKSKVFDFYNLDNAIKDNDFEPFSIYVTDDILRSMEKHYDIKYRILFVYYYKLQRSIFDKFFDENMFNKDNTKPHFKKANKAKNNVVIGSFGANDNYKLIEYELDGDKLKFNQSTQVNKKKAYYPLYLYINGRAKAEFIDILAKHIDSLIYANTDGFFTTKKIDFSSYNSKFKNGIGAVEYRAFYEKIAIKDISNYCGIKVDADGVATTEVKLSGRQHGEVYYSNFVNGFQSIIKSLSPYGFLDTYLFDEPSLDEFKEWHETIKKIETIAALKGFQFVGRDKAFKLRELERNEANKRFLDELLEAFGNGETEVINYENTTKICGKHRVILKLVTDKGINDLFK